jgi:hypothetical protein
MSVEVEQLLDTYHELSCVMQERLTAGKQYMRGRYRSAFFMGP